MTSTETPASVASTTSGDLNTTDGMDLSQTRAARKEHNKIVDWANTQFTMIKNARVQTERQWYLNLAFYFGKQNIVLLKNPSAGVSSGLSVRLYVPPAPYYRARPVINRIRPTIRTELSQLTGNKPNAMVVPASAEDRDMYAAMAGEQIWDNFYTDKKLKFLFRRAMWWTLVCGNGFIKSFWNNSKGPADQLTGEQEGDVEFISETPFHIFCPDLREEEVENQPFLIHAMTKSVDWVKMNFQQALDGSPVNPEETQAAEILDDSFLNLIGTQALNKQHNTLVKEVWVKPQANPMFPEGAFFTIVGDKIVQGQRGWPYKHGKFPFAKLDHIPGGKFYSTSLVEDLIPLQKEYNRTRGQIIEAKNRMAKPQLMAPRGSVDASKITTEPGQLIQYTPGFEPPTPLPLQPLPNYVLEEIDRILLDWSDIAGQHEVTQGTVPPGVTAATAISYLQERDESKLAPTFDSLEEAIEKLAQMSLSYVKDYWTTERMIRVTGPEGSFDTIAFKGSDLRNNLDIKIEAGSSLPTSKAAKQAFIMDLMKMGFVDPQRGLEVMDMGGINKIYEQVQVDRRQAQRENLRMSRVDEQLLMQYNQNNMEKLQANPAAFDGNMPPIIVPVNTWDNHQAHIEVHNNYRKGQAFENLSEVVKALFEAHVQQHIMALGVESETMHPRKSVGLQPEEEEEAEGEEGSEPGQPGQNQPGPNKGPQLQSENGGGPG